jgi:hypothetical protein
MVTKFMLRLYGMYILYALNFSVRDIGGTVYEGGVECNDE